MAPSPKAELHPKAEWCQEIERRPGVQLSAETENYEETEVTHRWNTLPR